MEGRNFSKAASEMIQREFVALKRRPKSNYFVVYDMVNENIFEWIIYIIGPPGTLYAGGIFRAVMRFPETYPMDPPSIQFASAMHHPNVYRDGKVCITTLQTAPRNSGGRCDGTEYWRPVLGVEQALLSVVSLLSDPNCDDPANQHAASEWVLNRKGFIGKVTQLVNKSKTDVPADFVMPVVVSGASESVGARSSSSSSSHYANVGAEARPRSPSADSRTGAGDAAAAEEEDEYVYSDDEEDGFEFQSTEFGNAASSVPSAETVDLAAVMENSSSRSSEADASASNAMGNKPEETEDEEDRTTNVGAQTSLVYKEVEGTGISARGKVARGATTAADDDVTRALKRARC